MSPTLKLRSIALLAIALGIFAAPVAMANLAPPDDVEQFLRLREKRKPVLRTDALTLDVRNKSKVEPTRIRIPVAFLKGMPVGDQNKVGVVTPPSSINRTLIAGFAIALAAGCLFVVLGRRIQANRPLATAAVLLIAVACFVGGATADIPVPADPSNPVDDAKNPGVAKVLDANQEKVIIEIVKAGDSVVIIPGSKATWVD